jgi:hypothetical protein
VTRGADDPKNPFRFGALALDAAFTDREREIEELSANIRNGQDVVLFAPRRFGKSSLIWRVAQELVTEDVLVAQVDLMRTPTKEKLAERLAKAIHEEIASRLFRTRERVRVFAGLRIKPTVTVDPDDGSLSFSFEASADAQDIDATLEGLLALPGRLAGDRKRSVALVIDEFQEVVDIDPGLPRLMRSVFQEQPEVAHVYLGSRRHMMERIFNDENEPFWRSAKQIELGVIPLDLFARYANERFLATAKRLDEHACARVLEMTGGHPYGTQEALYFLWEQTPPGGVAEADRLEGAINALLRSEHSHFSLLWSRAAASQRRVLQALSAEQPARPLTSGYRQRHGLPSVATVQTALDALGAAEVVARVGRGEYRIAEPFLAEWITRNES